VTLNTRVMDMASVCEKNNIGDVDESAHNHMRKLHLRCHLQNLLAYSPEGDFVSSSSTMQPADDFQFNALTLAKQALSASRQAAVVAEELKLIKVVDNDDNSLPLGLVLALWLTLASLVWLFICL
ncbi:RNA polymerase sigma factor sigF chloroplastic-like, partial [Trifolium medium]|nr:RNA polymerase sigma factor sigF chloroplastic-like [Trifolium medium]